MELNGGLAMHIAGMEATESKVVRQIAGISELLLSEISLRAELRVGERRP